MTVEKFDVASDNGHSADAVRELYRRIRVDIEGAGDDWDGGDVVQMLREWFVEHGFDVEGPNVPYLVDQQGDPAISFVEYFGVNYDPKTESIEDAFAESYQGTYQSAEDWAREQAEEILGLEGVALQYFDAEAFARDCAIGGDIYFADVEFDTVHVFRTSW